MLLAEALVERVGPSVLADPILKNRWWEQPRGDDAGTPGAPGAAAVALRLPGGKAEAAGGGAAAKRYSCPAVSLAA